MCADTPCWCGRDAEDAAAAATDAAPSCAEEDRDSASSRLWLGLLWEDERTGDVDNMAGEPMSFSDSELTAPCREKVKVKVLVGNISPIGSVDFTSFTLRS